MIDRPIKYAASEGSLVLPLPDYVSVSNPELMTHAPSDQIILRCTQGGFFPVHALFWSDGSRWDALNGMTQGNLPR